MRKQELILFLAILSLSSMVAFAIASSLNTTLNATSNATLNTTSTIAMITLNVTTTLNSTTSMSTTTTANTTSTSTISSTSTSATTTIRGMVPSMSGNVIVNILSGYNSVLVNGASNSQFNNTRSLSVDQLNSVTAKLLSMNVSVSQVQLNETYGSVLQSGKRMKTGSALYYVSYNGSGTATEYTVNVRKKVPDLKIKLGNVMANSSTGNMTYLQSVYTRIGNKIYPASTYSINPQLTSSLLGNNTLNYTYSIYVGGVLKASGAVANSSVNRTFSISNIPVSQPTKITFDAQGNDNYTSIDPTVYVFYSSSNIALTISSTTTLTGDLVCGTLTINSGIKLTTSGYSILCNASVVNSGTILAGNPANGGTGAGGVGGAATSSYGGSGGGGASRALPGNVGGTPSAPTLNNANIQTWYGAGGRAIQTYFEGAGGGSSITSSAGGSGSYGVYIQASKITEGTILANGSISSGASGSTTGAGGNGGATQVAGGTGGATGSNISGTKGGGGGGGACILLAYSSGGLTSGTGNVLGGVGFAGTATSGGNGGKGQALSYNYGSSAPIVVLQQMKISPTTISSVILDVGQSNTVFSAVSNGLPPYTGNWAWKPPTASGLSASNSITNSLPTNILELTLNPLSDTDLRYTFNGVNYDITTTGGKTIEGSWTFNGLVTDASTAAATNTLSTSSTPIVGINSLPSIALTPSSSSISIGSTETYTIKVTGGTGKFTAELYNVTGTAQQGTNVLIFSPGGSNTVSFVVNPVGSFTYNALVTDLGTTNPFQVNSIQSTITVSSATCIPVLSNTLIAFPNTQAGLFAPTSNAETITNGGTATADLLVDGGNWIASSSAFLVGNTLWSAVSGGNIGTQLTNSITGVDTTINIGAGSSGSVYFGLNVPLGQPPATYTETINVLVSC